MKDNRLYFIHIRECIKRVESYTVGGRDAFFADTMTQDAVIRNLQTLAESTRRVSPPLKAKHPEVEWRSIVAFRNLAVHDYLGIDLKEIWNIVECDLSSLKRQIEAILKELGYGG